jgi:ubiquinone/menaquinone biosynthesis C-methylase UbiE
VTGIRPLSHRSTNRKAFQLAAARLSRGARAVDIGAGEGYFTMLLGGHVRETLGAAPADLLSACDVSPELFRYSDVVCDSIDNGRLPYDDAQFDIACSLEVIEHVQDQFAFCREIFRILKPGGCAILSTPNVLNMNSRLRYLHSGFATLFDPLSFRSRDAVHTSGHIHPVTWYYLTYQLRQAGFASVDPHFDRRKTSAMLQTLVLFPVVALANALFRMRLRRRRPEVAAENRAVLRDLNGLRMLTSRSVIAVAVKP